MRNDMSKVLTERPRANRSWSYGDFRQKLNRGDLEDLPSRQGMRRPYQFGYDYHAKSFSDLIGPLRRFLHSSVGRPWNDVWSDICSGLTSGNTTHDHLKDHVRWMVEINTFLKDDKVYVLGRWGNKAEVTGLYVDPEDGILRFATKTPRYRRPKTIRVDGISYTKDENDVLTPYHNWNSAHGLVRKILGKEDEIAKRDGIWYRVEFDTIPDPVWCKFGTPESRFYYEAWRYFDRNDVVTGERRVAGQRYRSGFKALNSRDLKRFGVQND